MRRERRLPGRRGQRVAEDQLGVESIDNGGQGDRQLHAPAQDCPRLWMEADFLDLVAKPGYKRPKMN